MVAILDYEDIEVLVSKISYYKIESKNNISINGFGFEKKQVYAIYRSRKCFKSHMVFLLLRNEDKLHYVYIKKLYRFLYNKTKHKEKKATIKCL